tara:strand:+ start:574 stop:708 length:135 start_codon:yes stop_codon:yes gene_type:complete
MRIHFQNIGSDHYRTIQLFKIGFNKNKDFKAELSAILDHLSVEE